MQAEHLESRLPVCDTCITRTIGTVPAFDHALSSLCADILQAALPCCWNGLYRLEGVAENHMGRHGVLVLWPYS
jgi:hypothetical protein